MNISSSFHFSLKRTVLRNMRPSQRGFLFPYFLAITLVLVAGWSPAHAVTFGGFEIDGNLFSVDHIPPGDDWQTVPNLGIGIDALFGQDDNSFNNIKENTIPDNFDDKSGDPNVEVTTGGIPPNKSDFTRFYVAYQNFAGNEYLYLAWERTMDSGSATMDFELSQSNDVYPETGLPVRTEGDLLVTYDFGGNGNVTISYREWDGTKWGEEMDLSTSGFAEGAINTETVLDPISGEMLLPNTFGELAINLTGSGIIPADECINFGKAGVKSRSSNSFSSSMKDFVIPIDVSIGNCGFNIEKTADTDLSKAGDDVTYTFTVTNTGNPGSPALTLVHINDNVLGDLSAQAVAAGLDELDIGEAGSFDVTYTIQSNDPDPLVNTVTATYVDAGTFSQTDSASHTVNLFQPAVAIGLSGDTLSKVGDAIGYVITVDNLSSADSPNLVGTVTDPYDGSTTNIDLAPGEQYVESGSYTVQEADSDPLTRTATVTVSPAGFPNVLDASDDLTTNLFQPAVAIDLSGDILSKVGDAISYVITVDNLSSADSPNLVGTVTDPYDGSITGIDLAPGEQYVESGSYTVQEADSDPLARTATVTVSPAGFPNVLDGTDDLTTNLFQPAVAIDLSGDTLSKVGDAISYVITVDNLSSADSPNLEGTVTDPYDGSTTNIDLAPGEQYVESGSYTVQEADNDPLMRTASVTVSPAGFPNVLDGSDDLITNLFQPAVAIDLGGDTLSKVGDAISYVITVDNLSSADSPNLVGAVTDPYDGSITNINLAPGEQYVESGSYTVQEADSDPVMRTATVTVSPAGFPNVLDGSDDLTTNLFKPAVAIDLGGDILSKVGDAISYVITVDNLSSADSPNLVGTVTDPYDGSTTNIDLAPGEQYVESGSYTVQEADNDPLMRTASVTVSPAGFPNVLDGSDDLITNLFQPSIFVTKTGPAAASVGEDVTYTIVIENTSSADSPDLVNPEIDDSLLGDLSGADRVESVSEDGMLQVAETWTISTTRSVALTDPDPLVNLVTATFNPEGFPNMITGNDSHTVDILQPLLQIVKTPDGEIIYPGTTATFTIVVTNIGDGRAIDVMLDDILPTPNPDAGPLVWTVDALPGQQFANGDTFSILLGDLDPGASVTVMVSAAVPADYLAATGTPGGPGALGSNFEIDGDLVGQGMDTIDWGDLIGSPGFVNEPDQPTGQDDDSLGKGSKEDTDPPNVVTGSIPKNKSDLINFLFNQEIVDGNVFLEVGFIRANTLGTANMDFEFNQSDMISANGVTPVRTVGDILVSFDFASGGNIVELGLREWDGTVWSEAINLNGDGVAQGAVNDGFSVTNPLGVPDPLADKTFGEAVINLTRVFGDECRSFATAFVKSRSSDSFTSALKDFIAPISVEVNACQTIALPNTAAADAINHVPEPVTDDGLISITNDPGLL